MNKLLFLFAILLTSNSLLAQSNVTGEFQFDGRTRDYRLHLPPNYDENGNYPLVLNLHGLTSNASQQELYSAFNSVSDDNNFIVCYPNGVNSSWNSGFETGVDDVGFINELLDRLETEYAIDKQRIYSTGMSNGGFMSYKLACEMTDRLAAIASVTGSMVKSELEACTPSRPIPVMQIHGTADDVVPYNGSSQLVAVETLVEYWVSLNGCDTETITPVPNTSTDDDTTAELFTYGGCGDVPRVEFYRVENGGHSWPGAFPIFPLTNQDFSASEVIWAFFEQFSLESTSAVEPLAEGVNILIYPNPATDFLNIQMEDLIIENATIYDAQGRMILATVDNIINLSNLKKGVFYLKINTEEGTIGRSFVKQ